MEFFSCAGIICGPLLFAWIFFSGELDMAIRFESIHVLGFQVLHISALAAPLLCRSVNLILSCRPACLPACLLVEKLVFVIVTVVGSHGQEVHM